MNDVKSYVESLFKDYEQTSDLQEFKEEITSNLYARIDDLKAGGMDEEEAFKKAVSELGDITSIADEISRQKRNEILYQMYASRQTKIGLKHAIGYAVSGFILLFGVLVGFMTYFSNGVIYHGVSSAMPFTVVAVAGFMFLALTQETAMKYPMDWKRALIYAILTGVILFGLMTALMLYLMENRDMNAVIGVLIPFVLPELGLIVFMLLTEEKRYKPWVLKEKETILERHAKVYGDPVRMEKRGLLSGALWISAFALFLFIGFLAGWKYAVIVFLFAVAAEILIEFWMHAQVK